MQCALQQYSGVRFHTHTWSYHTVFDYKHEKHSPWRSTSDYWRSQFRKSRVLLLSLKSANQIFHAYRTFFSSVCLLSHAVISTPVSQMNSFHARHTAHPAVMLWAVTVFFCKKCAFLPDVPGLWRMTSFYIWYIQNDVIPHHSPRPLHCCKPVHKRVSQIYLVQYAFHTYSTGEYIYSSLACRRLTTVLVEQPQNSLEVHEVGRRTLVAPGTGTEALVSGVTKEQHRPFSQLAQPLVGNFRRQPVSIWTYFRFPG